MSRFLWLLIEAHHMRQLLSGIFLQYNEKGGSPKSRLQGSWKKWVDHRDKILSGLFSAA